MALPSVRGLLGEGVSDRAFAPLMLIARACLAFEIALFGIRKFLHPENIAAVMSSHGIPGSLIWFVIPFQISLGSLTLLGLETRIAAFALCGFCVIAPSIFHTNNLDDWARDIASAGGWIVLAVFGPGQWSLDARLDLPGQRILEPDSASANHLRIGLLVARLFIAVYFIACGLRDFSLTGPMVGFLHDSSIVLAIATLQVTLGLMILLGWHVQIATAVLAVYMLTLAWSVHSPATALGLFQPDESLEVFARGMFKGMGGAIGSYGKDIAVLGALLALLANGAGPLSLDARLRSRGNYKAFQRVSAQTNWRSGRDSNPRPPA
jgi:putative oxidoreductase